MKITFFFYILVYNIYDRKNKLLKDEIDLPDILKVTTPLVNKNEAILPKPGLDSVNAFNISETSKVIQPHNQSEILKQNTGRNNSDTPIVLLNMLKDPAVAVSYLKNISLLEEMFRLLPQNNNPITAEIENVFKELMINKEDIKQEFMSQENMFTTFKGPLFDFLREMSAKYRDVPHTQVLIANLLKSINNLANRGDILDSVANSLAFLKDNFESNPKIFTQIENLYNAFKSENVQKNVPLLKEEVLALIKEIEGSLLYSPKIGKVLSIMVYNLSRYNQNFTFFNESVYKLRQVLNMSEQKILSDFANSYTSLLNFDELSNTMYKEGLNQGSFMTDFLNRSGDSSSKVMDALIRLISTQSSNETGNLADAAKIDSIIQSLLSSPCNFTPLLHFIVPVLDGNMRAFAEIWINPQSDEKDMPEGVKSGIHFLMVVDVESIGRFEAEIFVYDKTVDLHLYCPYGYTGRYESMFSDVSVALNKINYKLGNTKIETMKNSRSLMDVFKSLPYKRMGVDVRI